MKYLLTWAREIDETATINYWTWIFVSKWALEGQGSPRLIGSILQQDKKMWEKGYTLKVQEMAPFFMFKAQGRLQGRKGQNSAQGPVQWGKLTCNRTMEKVISLASEDRKTPGLLGIHTKFLSRKDCTASNMAFKHPEWQTHRVNLVKSITPPLGTLISPSANQGWTKVSKAPSLTRIPS